MAASLILLNGPPASGKSTIARLLADARPLTLALDIDVIRGQLGSWPDQPTEAGLTARRLAVAMIDTHLAAGLDVIVPQFLARTDFVEQLEESAVGADASFVELVLHLSRTDAVSAFDTRRQNATLQTHRDAAHLVDRSNEADPVGNMFDALELFLESRPNAHRVAVVRGEIGATYDAVVRALAERGLEWPNTIAD